MAGVSQFLQGLQGHTSTSRQVSESGSTAKKKSSRQLEGVGSKTGGSKVAVEKVVSNKLQIEDDELFKAIGGQLLQDETFDYSRWQREQAGNLLKVPSKETKKKEKTPKQPTEVKSEKVIWLESKLRTTKQTLAQYKTLHKQFLHQNLDLKDQIEKDEAVSHADMRKLLRKYERFRGGIAALNGKFKETCATAKEDLRKTEKRIAMDLNALQEEVDALDGKVKETQKELNILVNYKDKEYPLKSLRISELQKELHNLHIQNNEESEELQHIIDTEMEKYRKERGKVQKYIIEEVTEEFLGKVHPSWIDMAIQNLIMEKEIEMQRKEMEALEEEIKASEVNVKSLLIDPRTNVRKQLFPQLFPQKQKCTPDMDIVLDIPTHDLLPI